MSDAVVVWRGPSALDGAPIRVQLVLRSWNRKIGDMVQAYILRDDMSPLDAMRTGSDASICGDCPLSGLQPDGSRSLRSCYVVVGKGPQTTWKYVNREISLQDAASLVAGRALRVGAYGDPAAVPLEVWLTLALAADDWLGYTHQWRRFPAMRDLFQASADSPADRLEAKAAGWRTFRASPDGEPEPGEIVCPNTTRGVKCNECRLCNGTKFGSRSKVADIVIEAHGWGRKNMARAAARETP